MVNDIDISSLFCFFFKEYLESDPVYFWYHYMKNDLVPGRVKDMLERILTIAIGSADAERYFSFNSIIT